MLATPAEELSKQLAEAEVLGRSISVRGGMSELEVAAVEKRIGTLLPLAVRDLFRATSGITIPDSCTLDFTGSLGLAQGAFSSALPISMEGGRTWVIDFASDGHCAVLLVSRNPHVVVVQASTLTTFIAQCFVPGGPWRLIQPYVNTVFSKNPYAVPSANLFDSRDAVLRVFARELGSAYLITDLRDARAGVGFDWRHQEIRRADTAHVFAVPAKRNRLGSWLRDLRSNF